MIETLTFNLVGINLLAYITIVLRPRLYKTKLYKPMLINIRLSIIPIIILAITTYLCLSLLQLSYNTNTDAYRIISVFLFFMGFSVWLLMLPNSGYLITELNFNHREHDETDVALWYDIVSILSLALSGVLNMCFNVFALQYLLISIINTLYHANMMGLWIKIVTVLLFILSSIGIYLGRYIRVNSWDIKHPMQFIIKLKNHFGEKGTFKNSCLFVLFHSLFFIVFYYATIGYIANLIFQE